MDARDKKRFETNKRHIKEYLSGSRSNPNICVDREQVEALERKYNIKLVQRERLSGRLFMYTIYKLD